jgi:hypothetical protein
MPPPRPRWPGAGAPYNAAMNRLSRVVTALALVLAESGLVGAPDGAAEQGLIAAIDRQVERLPAIRRESR